MGTVKEPLCYLKTIALLSYRAILRAQRATSQTSASFTADLLKSKGTTRLAKMEVLDPFQTTTLTLMWTQREGSHSSTMAS
jgi:hypothetical protein